MNSLVFEKTYQNGGQASLESGGNLPDDRGMRRNADKPSKIQSEKWRSENREQYNKLLRDYYHKNKEKLNEQCICEVCGRQYGKRWKAGHYKSQFHLTIQKLKEDLKK